MTSADNAYYDQYTGSMQRISFHHFSFILLVGCLITMPMARAHLPDNFAELSDDVQKVILEYAFFSEKAHKVWGQDYEEPSVHTMVKYLDDYHTRVHIDFAQGRIRVESERSKTPLKSLQHAIAATLLTPADPNRVDLYTATDMGLVGKPFLAGSVVDNEGQAITSQWRADRYSQYLVQHKLQKRGARYWVDIPMVNRFKQRNAEQYRQWVVEAARRYNVSPSLILAVMETESSFNPFAVSHAGAYGLMQVMQNTAGRDVFQRIYQRNDRPSREYLLDPARNIDAGTAYITILRDVYLREVKDPTKREYCIIAAYNGGTGNLLKAFHKDRKAAIARINAMSAKDVYQRIVRHHPKDESRRYLVKVTQAKPNYAHWNTH